jgi:hypothetical protein
MAVAYGSLTVPQLKQMLSAAHNDHRREMEETKAKWSSEVAMSKNWAKLMLELQVQKNDNATLCMGSSRERTP